VIVIICLCGAGCLGALTAALVFYRKLVPEAELEKHWRKLIGLVIVLAVGVPIMALLSMNDTRAADGVYVNGSWGNICRCGACFRTVRASSTRGWRSGSWIAPGKGHRADLNVEQRLCRLRTRRT
jgi:hypothetical protein